MANQKLNTVTFTVSGIAPFPFDMLRYDRAWPATERDATVLERIHTPGHRRAERVEVSVTSLSFPAPTVQRWESFGWRVEGARLLSSLKKGIVTIFTQGGANRWWYRIQIDGSDLALTCASPFPTSEQARLAAIQRGEIDGILHLHFARWGDERDES